MSAERQRSLVEALKKQNPFHHPVGPDSKIYQAYLKQKYAPFQTQYFSSSWRSFTGELIQNCNVSIDGNSYNNYYRIVEAGKYCSDLPERYTSGWEAIEACENRGGFPLFNSIITCGTSSEGNSEDEEATTCAYFNFSAQLLSCTVEEEETGPCTGEMCPGEKSFCERHPGHATCDKNHPNFGLYLIPEDESMQLPGDQETSQVSVSPGDQNGRFDGVLLGITGVDGANWTLSVTFKGQTIFSQQGNGLPDDLLPVDLDNIKENGIARVELSSSEARRSLQGKIRIDNDPPVMRQVTVSPTQNVDRGLIEAVVLERNNQAYQTGIYTGSFDAYFDGPGQLLYDTIEYDETTGLFRAEFTDYVAYNNAQQANPEYPIGFELVAEDYVGNEVSSRPPKDNLKLDIEADLWFSPHVDSTKKQAHFQVVDVDNAGAAWTVDIRRGGQVYKTYTGSGTQPLVWDGLFNGEAVPEGKYNIVLKNAKQPGKERVREVAKVGVDMTAPTLTKPLVKSRADGRQSVSIEAFDPINNGVRSGLNSDSFAFRFSSPIYNTATPEFIQRNRNKVVLEANLTEKNFGVTAEAGINVTPLSGSACTGYLLGSCVEDMAGNVTKDPFNNTNGQENGGYCLDPSTQQQLLNEYQKLDRHIHEALAEFENAELLVENPDFQTTALGDFRIQGLVSCEAGDCSIRDYSDRLSNYDRRLEAKEEAEWNNFLIQVQRQREIAAIYASSSIHTALTAGVLLAPIPMGAEFGAVALAYEIEQFSVLVGQTAPRVLAYALTHQNTYGDMITILRGYQNYTQAVILELGKDIQDKVVTCLRNTNAPQYRGPMTHAVNSQRGMVDFGKNAKKKLKLANNNLIYRGADGRLVIPKLPAHFYQKDLNGHEIGLLEVFAKPPNPHELDTIDYIMGQGHHLRLRAGVESEPDLMLKQFVPGTKPDDLPDSSFVFWDMKRVEPQVADLSRAIKGQIEKSAKNEGIVNFFSKNNLPHRVVVDVRDHDVNAAIAQNAIQRALGNYKNLSEITIIGKNKNYSWSTFQAFPSGFNPSTIERLN